MPEHQMSHEMRQCIDHCTACHQVCLQTIQHCLGMGGPHAERSHIRILADCAQICGVSADFMLRMSDLHGRTCGVCAEACLRCAADCERIAAGDAAMLACAATCRRCADSCQRMSAGGGG